jgi:hypothetical protein
LSHLKQKSIMPLELGNIGWRLYLQIGQNSLSRMREPSAIFDLELKSPDDSINVLLLCLSSFFWKEFCSFLFLFANRKSRNMFNWSLPTENCMSSFPSSKSFKNSWIVFNNVN